VPSHWEVLSVPSPATGDIVLPFPASRESLGFATEVRSTLIGSSVQSLRARGLFERYTSYLSAEHRAAILESVAGHWLPIAVGVAHYTACDRLGLSVADQFEMGASVSHMVHGTFLGAVVRLARNAGVTPWTLLPNGNRLYGRLLRGGGGTQVSRLGPKEASVEMVGIPMLAIPYYRNAVRGIYHAAVALFCRQAYVQEPNRSQSGTTSALLRIAWA
jgi:hypothetical protein